MKRPQIPAALSFDGCGINNEEQLIKNLHEQLLLWMKASKKKDKWNQYEQTTRTLKQAESFLEERGWTLEGKAK